MLSISKYIVEYTSHKDSKLGDYDRFDFPVDPPKELMFHTFSNFANTEPVMHPEIDELANFFSYERFGVHHIVFPTTEETTKHTVVPIDTARMRFPAGSMTRELTTFQKQHQRAWRTFDTANKIPSQRGVARIVNYNPLFRYQLSGMAPKVRFVDVLLRTILNTIADLKAGRGNNVHVIHIPLSPREYRYQDFVRAFDGFKRETVLHPEDYQYIFLMQLFTYIHAEASHSVFDELPPNWYDDVFVMFTSGKNQVTWNLKTIVELNPKNGMLKRMIRQIAKLSMSNYTDVTEQVPVGLLHVSNNTTESNFATAVDPEIIPTTNAQNEAFLEETLGEAEDFITNHETFSDAQKDRHRKLLKASMDIPFGDTGMSMKEILTQVPTETLPDGALTCFKPHEVTDASLLKSRVDKFDDHYIKHHMARETAQNLFFFTRLGMIPQSIESEDSIDKLTHLRKFKVTYVGPDGARHVQRFEIYIPDERGVMQINGTPKQFKKQLINHPIVKVNQSRVNLVSDHIKSIVDRIGTVSNSFYPYFSKMLDNLDAKVELDFGISNIEELKMPFEWTQIARRLASVTVTKGSVVTYIEGNPERLGALRKTDPEIVTQYGHCIGTRTQTGKPKCYLHLDTAGVLTILEDSEGSPAVLTSNLIDYFMDFGMKKTMKPLSEWVTLKILDQNFPLGFVLAYQYGLRHMLSYVGVDYSFIPKRKSKSHLAPSDIRIEFADGTLIVPRYPIIHGLLFSGLTRYSFKDIEFEQMETPDPYQIALERKGVSINYLRGIRSFFQMFISPDVRRSLVALGEPTNMKDLMLRVCSMLVTEDHPEPSAIINFRTRGVSKMNAILYNEMSRQYATWSNKSRGHSNKFTLKPGVVAARIVKDELCCPVDIINPIHDLKGINNCSYAGFGGRSSDTFMTRDRRYPKDGPGTLSDANVDNSGVGVSTQFSVDPNIVDASGFMRPKDISNVTSAELLSCTSLVMPGVTCDDGKRMNFVNGQMSQYMPCAGYGVGHWTTGYDKVVSHRGSEVFAKAAEQDGVVETVDTKADLAVVRYKDGTKDTVFIGTRYMKNGGGGFYTTQKAQLAVTKGKKFKKGDILAYNPEFYEMFPGSTQVHLKLGHYTNIALLETEKTFEDSCYISEELSRKLTVEPNHDRTIMLSKHAAVHSIAAIGTHVEHTSPLLLFEENEIADGLVSKVADDPEALELLAKFNGKIPKAECYGTVVDIEILYNCDVSSMSSSMQKLVTTFTKKEKARAKYAKGTKSERKYLPPMKLNVTRIGITDLPEDSAVVIKFIIQHENPIGVSDKLVAGPSLKTTVHSVAKFQMVAIETGEIVDMMFGNKPIYGRITTSPYTVGFTERLFEHEQNAAVREFFA